MYPRIENIYAYILKKFYVIVTIFFYKYYEN